MPYEVINKLRGPSTIRVTGAQSTGALALGAFSANQAIENVHSLVVNSIKFALVQTTGTLTITRDALVVATLYGTGDWKHDEHAISNTSTGTITVAIAGGGTALLSVSKHATYNVASDSMDRW